MTDILVPILCTLLGGLIGYRLGLSQFRLQVRNDYAEKLYKAFQPICRRLETETDTDAIHIIEPTIKEQEDAVMDYMRHLPGRKARSLQTAWENYLSDPYTKKAPCLEQYADTGSIDKRQRIRPELLAKLQAILKFAKPI